MERTLEHALMDGDLSILSTEQRADYYQQTCESLGLNPLTQPFGYLVLNGKLRMYALKGCTDQLRQLRKISIEIISMQVEGDLFMVHVRARDEAGRLDEDVGFATIAALKGDNLGNAKLKAITKSKRRVTLSICGLGMLDASEVDTIPGAQTYAPDAVPATTSAPTTNGSPATAEPHPTALRIDDLFKIAEACREPKELFGRRLREIMGRPGDVRMSKKYLLEHMTTTQYTIALSYYEQLLRQQVERDVPTHEPPAQTRPATEPGPAPPEETPAAVPSQVESGSASGAEADRARLRAEVATWMLRVNDQEVEHIIAHHPYARARALLWKARLQPSGEALVAD